MRGVLAKTILMWSLCLTLIDQQNLPKDKVCLSVFMITNTLTKRKRWQIIFSVISTICTLNFTADVHTVLSWAIKISERNSIQLARVAGFAKYLPWSKTVTFYLVTNSPI